MNDKITSHNYTSAQSAVIDPSANSRVTRYSLMMMMIFIDLLFTFDSADWHIKCIMRLNKKTMKTPSSRIIVIILFIHFLYLGLNLALDTSSLLLFFSLL